MQQYSHDHDPEIAQVNVERWLRDEFGVTPWTTLYRYVEPLTSGVGIYCGLMPLEFSEQATKTVEWDIEESRSVPSLSVSATYRRNTNLHGIEPVIIARDFHLRKTNYVEVCEELKLLFNLFEDRVSGTYYLFQDNGDETPVIRTSLNSAEVLTSFIRRYLAARQMALLLQVDSIVWKPVDGNASPQNLPDDRQERAASFCFDFWSNTDDRHVFSRLLGKKILLPPAVAMSELWPFSKNEQYADFIVGEDEMGHPIRYSCDPMRVPSSWAARPDGPNRLTPVFFSREVLRKYLSNPDRYEVGDGGVRCGPVWHLRADTAHPDHVSAFLGDLGTDLPTSEQRYWQAHELSPVGLTQSEASVRRSFYREHAHSELPEHRFKRSYATLKTIWTDRFGWSLYKDLHEGDRHVLVGLHTPLQNTTADFDQQVGYLAKVVVDSLNEEAISNAAANSDPARGEKGIAKFERLLGANDLNYPEVERDTIVLRMIQGVRSRGAAHRRAEDYDISVAGLDPSDLPGSFNRMLEGCILMFDSLVKFIRPE